MVRKVDKTKLLTVIGIIIFLFGGAVRIFSHLTSSADNYMENFDVIIFSGLIIGWGVSVSYRIVQKNIRICLVISATLMLLWMGSSCYKIQQPCRHQHIRTVPLVFILHSNGVFAAYDVFCNAEYR